MNALRLRSEKRLLQELELFNEPSVFSFLRLDYGFKLCFYSTYSLLYSFAYCLIARASLTFKQCKKLLVILLNLYDGLVAFPNKDYIDCPSVTNVYSQLKRIHRCSERPLSHFF